MAEAAAKTSGLAIASLVLSILSLTVGMLLGPAAPVMAILGVIFGHVGRAEIRRDPDVGGEGLATAGLIIGYLALLLMLLLVVLFLLPAGGELIEPTGR